MIVGNVLEGDKWKYMQGRNFYTHSRTNRHEKREGNERQIREHKDRCKKDRKAENARKKFRKIVISLCARNLDS